MHTRNSNRRMRITTTAITIRTMAATISTVAPMAIVLTQSPSDRRTVENTSPPKFTITTCSRAMITTTQRNEKLLNRPLNGLRWKRVDRELNSFQICIHTKALNRNVFR